MRSAGACNKPVERPRQLALIKGTAAVNINAQTQRYGIDVAARDGLLNRIIKMTLAGHTQGVKFEVELAGHQRRPGLARPICFDAVGDQIGRASWRERGESR